MCLVVPWLEPQTIFWEYLAWGNCASNRISLLYIHKLNDTFHDTSALYHWRIYNDISSFVKFSVHNVLHVVASAGTGGRLGPMAINASHSAGMHKIQSLLTYVKHIQSPQIFQDTLYILSSQQYEKRKQMSQTVMSLWGSCPWPKSAYMRHWKGPKSRLRQAFYIQLRA